MELKKNRWNYVGDNEESNDFEFMKIIDRKETCELSYLMYTPANAEMNILAPIVQLVVMEIESIEVYQADQDTEDIVNSLALNAIIQMNKTGIIFNPKTEENSKIVLDSLGINNTQFSFI